MGDLLLKSMANIFSRVCRDKGFVTRFGGDEFIIFLYTGEKKTLEATAKAIHGMEHNETWVIFEPHT